MSVHLQYVYWISLPLQACTHIIMHVPVWFPSVDFALQSSRMILHCSSCIGHSSICSLLSIRSRLSICWSMDLNTICCQQDYFLFLSPYKSPCNQLCWEGRTVLLLLYKFLTISLQLKFSVNWYEFHVWDVSDLEMELFMICRSLWQVAKFLCNLRSIVSLHCVEMLKHQSEKLQVG